jgi:hypothetical protein
MAESGISTVERHSAARRDLDNGIGNSPEFKRET